MFNVENEIKQEIAELIDAGADDLGKFQIWVREGSEWYQQFEFENVRAALSKFDDLKTNNAVLIAYNSLDHSVIEIE